MGTTKAAIYLRQSLDRDQNKLAIDRQRDLCLELCDRRGWTDIVEYPDNDTSASAGHRPGYARLLADIEAGSVNAVVVYHLDRLHRQPRELEDFIDLADKHRLALATVTGDVDLGTDTGRLIARILGAVARGEVDRKSIRQKDANKQRAHAGRPWVTRPFGYTRHVFKGADGKVVKAWNEINPIEADAIKKASGDLIDGASLWSIAAGWNEQGLKTSKGNTWTGGQVRAILLRPRNAGLAIYDGQVLTDVEAAWDPIVDRELWESVCKLLADPKRHTGKSQGRKHLLSGIAICDVCHRAMGTTMRKLKSGGNRPVYQCKRLGCMKIVRDLGLTDERVIDSITQRLAQPDAAVTLARPTVDGKALRAQIEALRAQIKDAEHEYDEGIIDGRRLAGRLERVNEKLAPLQDKMLGSHMSRDVKDLAGKADARQRFDALPLDRRRGVVDMLAVVTIHTQRKGGRFDPAAITVKFK